MILHCTRNIQDETCESKTKFGTFSTVPADKLIQIYCLDIFHKAVRSQNQTACLHFSFNTRQQR